MISAEELKEFSHMLIDLHRDSILELLHNPEFQENDLNKKEQAVNYISILFKKEIDERISDLKMKGTAGNS